MTDLFMKRLVYLLLFVLVGCANGNEFKTLLAGAKQGKIVLPPELAHLGQFIVGFNA